MQAHVDHATFSKKICLKEYEEEAEQYKHFILTSLVAAVAGAVAPKAAEHLYKYLTTIKKTNNTEIVPFLDHVEQLMNWLNKSNPLSFHQYNHETSMPEGNSILIQTQDQPIMEDLLREPTLIQ